MWTKQHRSELRALGNTGQNGCQEILSDTLARLYCSSSGLKSNELEPAWGVAADTALTEDVL